ncbi:MAG TPA: right-handed parallel beta-helix repeat-containing protein, partial [Kribbella sp.]|nr:right-handed parallel beta-helix repeat-containing protein [Kribbella sp.]
MSTRSVQVHPSGAVPRPDRCRAFAVVATSAVVAALATVVPAAPAMASTTYLVRQHDRSCSDSGPGHGSKPFCTISAAAKVAAAGDTVRVGAGTYREQVTPHSGVTFVGSRRSTEVVGSDSLASASWSPAGGNAWSTVLGGTSAVSQVFTGQTRLSRAAGAARTATESWSFDAPTHTLYVDLGGPAPRPGNAIAAVVRQYGFLVRNVRGVTVKGFTMRHQGGAGILLDNSTHCVVRSVTVTGSASYGINDQGGTSDRIIRAHASHNASIGIRLFGTSSSSVTSSVSRSNG